MFPLKVCQIDHYKSAIGNTDCKKCPDGKTNNTMHKECECKEDYYIGEKDDSKCYGMYIHSYF